MLLQSLRALCNTPGGAGSIRKYLEAVVRATGVSGRFVYGFRTKLHSADVLLLLRQKYFAVSYRQVDT